jgi:ADP-ribose pyrophosphatase
LKITSEKTEFRTPWFELVSKQVAGEPAPFYALRMSDYVTVVAFTPDSELLLVRQYRPAVDAVTLELPSGHVDGGETPEAAARRELAEECGFAADKVELLGTLLSDTGRNENRLWCYLAADVKSLGPQFVPEAGVEPICVQRSALPQLIERGELAHALNVAALMLAVLRKGPELFALK